jgi:ketosteroid isomerase-like protein
VTPVALVASGLVERAPILSCCVCRVHIDDGVVNLSVSLPFSFECLMTMRRVALCSAILGAICACSSPHFDASAAQAALLRRDAEWADAATAGKDVDRIVSYWTDDALIIFPGQPTIEGKKAIRDYVARSLATPGFSIHWVSEKPEFSPDGKLAYMRGTDQMTVPGGDGKPMTIHLRGLSVWRMEPDGQWRCVAEVSNEVPPAAPSST